jgi:hypothetical protein
MPLTMSKISLARWESGEKKVKYGGSGQNTPNQQCLSCCFIHKVDFSRCMNHFYVNLRDRSFTVVNRCTVVKPQSRLPA